MKTVFSNRSQTCHVWASRQQNYGRSRDGRIFFENDIIYSYGYHFPMAAFYPELNIVLYNSQTYSSSTSGHQSYVRGAISHWKIIEVPEVLNNYDENVQKRNLNYFTEKIKDCREKFDKARDRAIFWHRQQKHFIGQLEDYCDSFNCLVPDFVFGGTTDPDNFIILDGEAGLKDQYYKDKREEREQKELEELEQIKNGNFEALGQARSEWFAGKRNSLKFKPRYLTVNLFDETKLRVKNGMVQTTEGAEVPLEDAKRLFYKYEGKATPLKGEKVGHFTVDKRDDYGLKIGCHYISKEEIYRFAKSQNWI